MAPLYVPRVAMHPSFNALAQSSGRGIDSHAPTGEPLRFQSFALATWMIALACQFRDVLRILATVSAVILALGRHAVAGCVLALLRLCHLVSSILQRSRFRRSTHHRQTEVLVAEMRSEISMEAGDSGIIFPFSCHRNCECWAPRSNGNLIFLN